MLVLGRNRGETIRIGADIDVTVVDIKKDRCTIGVNAPGSVRILRQELYDSGARLEPQKQNGWSKNVPNAPGTWLRINIAKRIEAHDVIRMGNDIHVGWGASAEVSYVPDTYRRLRGWWWLGPIPAVPKGGAYVPSMERCAIVPTETEVCG